MSNLIKTHIGNNLVVHWCKIGYPQVKGTILIQYCSEYYFNIYALLNKMYNLSFQNIDSVSDGKIENTNHFGMCLITITGHGNCSDVGFCQCERGWGLTLCDQETCPGIGVPCSGKGVCNGQTCSCSTHWQGKLLYISNCILLYSIVFLWIFFLLKNIDFISLL